MSAIVGERDTLIMNTVPRYAAPIDRDLRLTASSTTFEVSLTGQPTPATITFSALMLGAVGEVAFSSEPPVALTVSNGDAVLKFEDMTTSIVTVTATTVIDGLTYFDRQTVDKRQALDLRPPPAPTGLATTGQPAAIRLNWDAAPANYANLDYTEIWRAPVNDIAQAAPVGRADGREFTDPVGPGKTLYYWIRYVSRAAIPGPFNNSTGTVGASAAEVEHLLQVLTGQITEGQLYADLGAKIDKIEQLEDVFGDAVSAAQSAAAAELSRAAADQAAGLAAQYRGASAQSAISAETDAAKAASKAAESAQSSTNAGASAAAASSSKDLAVQAANGAGQSAIAAAQSSSSASGFANAAGQSATSASGSATTANTNAGQAGTYAGQAASSATAANGSATAAASFLQQAQAILNDPITGLVDKYAAVKVLADATASALDGARARYAVQLDTDGVAGGFELIGGGGRIDAGWRATSFFIAGPAGGPVAPSVPFIVRTTETVIDGVTIPIGTYIADAFIQNASITNAKIGGDIWSSNFIAGQSGWRLYRSGDMEINNLRARGSVMGGAYTSYAWPENNGIGYYLGPEGFLFGNPSTGRYLQLGAEGNIYTPGLSVVNGRANFSGNVNTGMGAGFRIEMGPDDPVYAMWAGSGAKTDANAIFYLKRTGAGYFGGSLSAGMLRTAVANPSLDANVQLVNGPFGTNGSPITVVCSYEYSETGQGLHGTYSASGAENTATIQLYRTIEGVGETLVQTVTASGSTTIDNASVVDEEWSRYNRSLANTFTFTDNAGGSQNRTYRAVLSGRVLKTVQFTVRPGQTGQFRPVSTRQTLSIITTE